MEAFLFTVVFDDSKFDRVQAGTAIFTDSEERGGRIFFGQNQGGPGGGSIGGPSCVRCHGDPNFDNNQHFNIGLDYIGSITDLGRELVTGNANDRVKFKTISSRNIAVTAPYCMMVDSIL